MKSSLNVFRAGRRRAAAATLIVVVAAALPSCDIETKPLGVLTAENFFQTPDQAVQATNATYSMLRDWQVHVFSWLGLTDIISDDATKGSVPGDAGFLGDLDNLNLDPGNTAFSDPWSGYYKGIFRANVAIQGIGGSSIDAALKSRLIGENKFLRAYFYFFLVRGWGGVPLFTAPLKPSEYKQARATKAAVYAQIEQDLNDAITALPEWDQYAAADRGRASKGAARSMLAEVYLYQAKYEEAYSAANTVITSGKYSLFPSYETLFTQTGENSSESVFEVEAAALPGGSHEREGAATQYAEVQGIRSTPNTGWGFNTPSPELEDSYEPGDPRLEATILYPWELLPDGSGQVVYLNPSMPNNRYNQKVFVSPSSLGGSGNSGVNIRRIRYADVLLVGAEAAARTNRAAQALNWLNLVRQRARGGHTITIGVNVETFASSIENTVLGLPAATSKVLVRFVDPDDPAYAAGLRSFAGDCTSSCPSTSPPPIRVLNADIITAVDATPVTTLPEYYAALDTKAPGAPVVVSFLRVTQSPTGVVTSTPMTATVNAQLLLPPVVGTGQALVDAIWAERRAELGMEQHRWFDIIREGRAQAAMAVAGKTFVVGKHELFPIPSGEVAIAGLTQNPGY
jgi:SusD/RagB-like outer membrane lipoprotein